MTTTTKTYIAVEHDINIPAGSLTDRDCGVSEIEAVDLEDAIGQAAAMIHDFYDFYDGIADIAVHGSELTFTADRDPDHEGSGGHEMIITVTLSD
jgi:hypothetical protein